MIKHIAYTTQQNTNTENMIKIIKNKIKNYGKTTIYTTKTFGNKYDFYIVYNNQTLLICSLIRHDNDFEAAKKTFEFIYDINKNNIVYLQWNNF